MAAKDLYHNIVLDELKADGWTITDDPFTITYGSRDLYVDIGAEKETIGATKADRRVAIEVKSFLHPSPVTDLHRALGQYVMYEVLLNELDPTREIYVAVSDETYKGVFSEEIGQLLILRKRIKLLVFDIDQNLSLKWIN